MKSKNMMKVQLLPIIVAVTFVVMVSVNALANILPINGVTSGAVSDSYPNLFAPAGITFSIWGIIYLLLAGYTIFQFDLFQTSRSKRITKVLREIGWYFGISSLLNASWIFAWHHRYIGVSLFLITGILICLIKIADILRKEKFSTVEKIAIRLPFSVYFGWITIAVIANVTTFLVSMNWNGWGIPEQVWLIVILFVGAAIGFARMIYDRNIPYGIVLIWGYSGILLKHLASTGFDKAYPAVIVSTLVCMCIFITGGWILVKK